MMAGSGTLVARSLFADQIRVADSGTFLMLSALREKTAYIQSRNRKNVPLVPLVPLSRAAERVS
jgi:hypothetical protein